MIDSKDLDFTDDPYWGKGGSYVVDPLTGKRSPVDGDTRTGAPVADEARAPEAAPPPVPGPVAEHPAAAASAKSLKGTRNA